MRCDFLGVWSFFFVFVWVFDGFCWRFFFFRFWDECFFVWKMFVSLMFLFLVKEKELFFLRIFTKLKWSHLGCKQLEVKKVVEMQINAKTLLTLRVFFCEPVNVGPFFGFGEASSIFGLGEFGTSPRGNWNSSVPRCHSMLQGPK